ncbi:MAG: alkaline phosphatase [Halomonas sp.]|uniref:alkaline phosphatase n=1 Tax=Halomonas sp. TaxID=1486246 RepID=UPI0019F6FA7E|nr:alkaline phosphatase [Halomonas sp.]MBE0489214.1 alkaline phosphatase [Halomonas sp.]
MLRLLGIAVLLNLLLLLPLWLRFGGISTRWIALEAVLLVALLVLLPAGRLGWLRPLLTFTVVMAVLAGLGDVATHLAFGRSLNLYLDLPLLRSVFHLLEGNLGIWAAWAASLAALLLIGLGGWALNRALRAGQRQAPGGSAAPVAVLLLVASTTLMAAQWHHQRWLPVARAPAMDTLRFQGEQLVETHRAHREFSARMAAAPIQATALPGLAGRDVLLVFVESYGVSAVFDAPFAEVVAPRLDEMAERLAAAGLSMATGVLEAPIRGGQSWLAHASTLGGLSIDNSLWYRLMLASGRSTLVDDFRATGHRTLTVMPAITLAWPEGEAYGFDEIHAAADIDYAGPPLHWVTMPDQFTLHHFEQRIREPAVEPLFVQIALISSHAPWTPILPVLDDWDAVGDGSVFHRWEDAGDPPDVLWQDMERVRDHYALSVDYALHASARWAEAFVDDETLLILLGDHQAAPLIIGEQTGFGVPVHVISGDAALLAPFLARGFVAGMRPEAPPPIAGLDALRGWLHEDFGE